MPSTYVCIILYPLNQSTNFQISVWEFYFLSPVFQAALPPVSLYPHLLLRFFYPRQGASSAITAPSDSSGLWHICSSFSWWTCRSRVLYSTTAIDILAYTKPHISQYSLFRLKLRCEDIFQAAVRASFPSILSAEKIKEFKWRLQFIQSWRYLSYFSFSAFARALSGVMQR